MIILGIETSCDETACAAVEGQSPARNASRSEAGGPTLPVKVLSNVVASSGEMHIKTGGIVPEVASREQLKAIIPVLNQALAEARISIHSTSSGQESEIRNKIDAIAVTVGPGLIGSLLVGVETAKVLADAWGKKIIPVNHLVAHLYANFVGGGSIPEFPAIGLVVSGGHTDLVLMEQVGPPSRKATAGRVSLRLLGRTRDDAAGECFDKGARLLGLPYPGGPAIARAAQEFSISNFKFSNKPKIKLPRPMINDDNYDFSFSGLKTALRLAALAQAFGSEAQARRGKPSHELTSELAYELQEAIVEVLVAKVVRVVKEFKPKSVLLGGGVAANSRLRELLSEKLKVQSAKLFIPEPKLCTDNAVSIAAAAYYNYAPVEPIQVEADPSLEIV